MPLAQSTHTALDITTAVKRQFGDESGTQISATDILRWINQGQAEIVRRGEVNKSMASTLSVANQGQYTFVDNIYKILGVFYNNQPLFNVTFEQAQQSFLDNPDTINLTSTPTNWYEYDDSIYLYPIPTGTGDTIKLYAIKAPTPVTSNSDILTIPDTHYQALLQYVLQQAYELDDNFSSASVKSQQMVESMGELMNVSTYATYPVITILPEDQ